jgi:prephenate dehydrogenase (NADP+)
MMQRPDVTPDLPIADQPTIGLIGMGAMGRMYAKHLSDAGWKKCASNQQFTHTDNLIMIGSWLAISQRNSMR